MKPWICPKCGRVWSGLVEQCRPCNQKVDGQVDARGYPMYPRSPRAGDRGR